MLGWGGYIATMRSWNCVKGGFVVAISCARGGLGVRGDGGKVESVGYMVKTFGFGIYGVSGLAYMVKGFGCGTLRVSGLAYMAKGFGCGIYRISGLAYIGFRIWRIW